jgi:hypothetical protein
MKSKEHILQTQIIPSLRKLGYLTMDCDVMDGLKFLPKKDKRRFGFVKQHKNMGYTVGQSDLVIISPKGRVFFVEMKNGKEGVQSEDQKWFERIVTSYGLDYLIWRTPEDVMKFIKGEKGDNNG